LQKAEEQYKRTSKKFGQSSKAWTLFAEFCLKRGAAEDARALLPRALQSLEKRKRTCPSPLVHMRSPPTRTDLKTISKFAQLEYRLGDPERGKTIFEGIVDSHPRRWDLWSIYMDMEARQKDIQSLRCASSSHSTSFRLLTSHVPAETCSSACLCVR
jgi:rRNA biogenesis protein RRP5